MYTIPTIAKDTYYIGANDRRLDLFENLFPIPDGVCYNSYFIDDEKTAVLDTVDKFVSKPFFDNMKTLLNGKPLDYLVINHMEPDHCANIAECLLRYPDLKIVCNQKTFDMIGNFFNIVPENVVLINEGDELCLGEHTLSFHFTPMVHWPEVMVTYDKLTKTLYSADAFGNFGALDGHVFNDEKYSDTSWIDEARRYYTNIVGKFGRPVLTALKKLSALDIEIIAPLHGCVYRKDIPLLLEKYTKWASYIPEEKGVLIAYASMYGNTEDAANKLALTLGQKGVKNIVIKDVSVTDVSYLIAHAFRYTHIVIASPTYNLHLYPKMEYFVNDMINLSLKDRRIAIMENGSWAPAVVKQVTKLLEKDFSIMDEKVLIKSALKDGDDQIDILANALAIECQE